MYCNFSWVIEKCGVADFILEHYLVEDIMVKMRDACFSSPLFF